MNIKSMIILLSLLTSAEASADCTRVVYGNCLGGDYNSVRAYSPDGRYMGNLNDNQFDPNSVSNPFGRYGNPYLPDSPYSNLGYGGYDRPPRW